MKARNHIARLAAYGLMAVALAGCVGYDQRAGNTMIGAGVGAAAGGVLSEGDPLYMLGGAAAGGLLGNILTEDRSYRGAGGYYGNRRYAQNWERGNNWRRDRSWNDRDRDRDRARDRDRDREHRNRQSSRDRARYEDHNRSWKRGSVPLGGRDSAPFGRASRGGDNFNK